MSVPTTPSGAAPPKQMSSRLMTMKFMQRGAAVQSSRSQTPASEPPSKRRRVDTLSGASTPTRTSDSDLNATPRLRPSTQTPSRSEYVREGNETEWVLNVSHPAKAQSLPNGFSPNEEGDDDDIWSSAPTGRQTYGSFKRKKDQPAEASADKAEGDLSSVSSSSDSEDEYQKRRPAKTDHGPSRNQHRNDYGSPLTRIPNNKERRKQNRTSNKKKARKTM